MLQRKDIANPPYGNANIALVSSLPYHLSRWVGELMRIVQGDHNRMRAVNRGDIPAPHVARSEEKAIADPAEDVVFDAGSLSFVQDWVEGGDGGADATTEGELDRQGPRQSNPNRRLGVGAQPKKPKQERVCSLTSLAQAAAEFGGRRSSKKLQQQCVGVPVTFNPFRTAVPFWGTIHSNSK